MDALSILNSKKLMRYSLINRAIKTTYKLWDELLLDSDWGKAAEVNLKDSIERKAA